MRATVELSGFVLQRKFLPHLSTVEVAHQLGRILDIDKLLPSSGIPTVQSLRPRGKTEVKENQYSGNYGLGVFPLHTDLAHWILPPHYLLLRCVIGTEDVFTNLLPCAGIVGAVGKAALEKSVFRIRRHRHGCSGLVRAMSSHLKENIFRWDPIFIEPLNKHAQALKLVMTGLVWNEAMTRIALRESGDTLVIDNWRMLHGRSQVPAQSLGRQVERVYLSEVFNDC